MSQSKLSQAASILGKKSAEKQYGHMSKEEKSKAMRKLRQKGIKKQKTSIDLPLDK